MVRRHPFNSRRDRRRAGLWLPEVRSLKLRLLLVASALAVSILAVTWLTLSRGTARVAEDQARKDAAVLLSYFSDTLAEAVAARDRMQIHVHAEALLRNGVHSLALTDADGKSLYASSGAIEAAGVFTMPGSAAGVETVRVNGHDLLHVSQVVHFGETPVGTIALWLDKDDLEKNILVATAHVYPVLALGFALMALLGALVLCTPFRAIKRLTAAVERMGSDDLSARVPVNGRDEVADLCRVFNDMGERLESARNEVKRKQLETIHAMINALEAKDAYTEGHCLRVSSFTRDLLDGYEDLPRDERFMIETAALLHDVGKIGVPDEILLKRDELSPEETIVVQSHVTIGENILAHLDSMKRVARWIRHHHERWDGTGYPDALAGDTIPFASRVITVADTIDAMMTDRPYRRGLSRSRVIQILEEQMGKQFDPDIAARAVEILHCGSAGSTYQKGRKEPGVSTAPATDRGGHERKLQPA